MEEIIQGYRFVGNGQYRTIRPAGPGMVQTAAVMTCNGCGTIIAAMGGPGHHCYCPKCFDVMKMEAFARGKLLECVD